jgi:hypothetical protein
MKFKKCFIDHHGNIWRDTTLMEASKDLPVKSFEINQTLLEEVVRWKFSNLRDYMIHYKRVRECDCSIPIILRSDGYPMDGWHRIIKALAEGKKLTCKQFIKEPKPDFKQDSNAPVIA